MEQVKYKIVAWKKKVNGWPESTGCVIDENFSVVDTIDMIFEKGEFSPETIEKKIKYKIKGTTFGKTQDYWHVRNTNDYGKITKVLTPEEACQIHKEECEMLDNISNFLTPEKGQELLNLLKPKN